MTVDHMRSLQGQTLYHEILSSLSLTICIFYYDFIYLNNKEAQINHTHTALKNYQIIAYGVFDLVIKKYDPLTPFGVLSPM